jgi:PKD repeat protein
MRKKLLLTSFVLGLAGAAFAQNTIETKTMQHFSKHNANLFQHHKKTGSRNATCGPDTAMYSFLKDYFADPSGSGLWADYMVGPNRTWSQGFELDGSATISGITFYGFVQDDLNPLQTISAKVYLYNVDGAFMPTTPIDSALVTVGTTPNLYSVDFATPLNVNSDYAVAVRNPVSTDTLAIVMNNASASTYGEGLGWRRFGSGTWNTAVAYAGQDVEPIIAPHISFDVVTDYSLSPSATECLGTPISFTNVSTDPAVYASRFYSYGAFNSYWGTAVGDSAYYWNMDDGTFIWDQNALYTYAAAGSYDVTLYTITGLYTACIDMKVSTITINSDDASITSTSPVCEGTSSFDLVAATSGGTWSGPGITDANAGTFDPTTAGVGMHTISYLTNGTCPATGTTTVTVAEIPVLTVSDPAAVCEPTTVDLTDAAVTAGSTGNGTLTYWTDAAITSALSSPGAVGTAGTYYIQSVSAPGCADTASVVVTTNPSPVLMISDPASVCEPNTIDLTDAAVTAGSTGSGTLTYWTDAGATSSLTSPAAVATGGTYYIQSDLSGCTDIESVSVTIDPLATSSFTVDNSTEPIIAFTSTSSNETSYSWDFGDGSLADITANPTHVYTANGSYTVTLTVGNNCGSDVSTDVVVITGIGINENSMDLLSVYPNPSAGIFTVDLGVITEATVEVYNVLGSKVFAKVSNTQISKIDLSAFETGVYVLKVRTENAQTVKQITITK